MKTRQPHDVTTTARRAILQLSLSVAGCLAISGCDKLGLTTDKAGKSSKDENDDDDDKPSNKDADNGKQKQKNGTPADSVTKAADTPTSAPKLPTDAFLYGVNLSSAHSFAASKSREKFDKYMGRAQANARGLGLAAPAAVKMETFGADVGRITKEVLDKHGVRGRALFVCGLQVREGFTRALDNEDIVKNKLKEPLFDVRPHVGDLETSLPRTGVPQTAWKEQLAKVKAAPTSANFQAMLEGMAKALDEIDKKQR